MEFRSPAGKQLSLTLWFTMIRPKMLQESDVSTDYVNLQFPLGRPASLTSLLRKILDRSCNTCKAKRLRLQTSN